MERFNDTVRDPAGAFSKFTQAHADIATAFARFPGHLERAAQNAIDHAENALSQTVSYIFALSMILVSFGIIFAAYIFTENKVEEKIVQPMVHLAYLFWDYRLVLIPAVALE